MRISEKSMKYLAIVALIVLVGAVIPELSYEKIFLLDNTAFKVLLLVIVVILTQYDTTLAVLATIAFVVLLNKMNKSKVVLASVQSPEFALPNVQPHVEYFDEPTLEEKTEAPKTLEEEVANEVLHMKPQESHTNHVGDMDENLPTQSSML